jgi:hypothetical protein
MRPSVVWPYVTEDKYLDLVEERDDLVEERDGLRVENDKLRAALNEIGQMTAGDPNSYRRDDPEWRIETVHAKSVAALAPPAAPARRTARYSYSAASKALGEPPAGRDARPYTIAPAKYAKRMMAIRCTPDGTGFKTRAARLAEVLARGRWSNREGAYILSSAAAARFEKLYSEGYDGEIMGKSLIPPATP